ncbi:MAG: flagellar basal body-associated FliL family protein [Gammaproteobacteria bacterium]|nr:flagellar basal body-associated FliL family protein [Gammaproteobacteria bacterium]
MAETAVATEAPVRAGARTKLFVIMGVTAVLVLGGAGAAYVLLAGGDSGTGHADAATADQSPAHEAAAEPVYFSLAPAFVVNFQAGNSRARFLKVELDGSTRTEHGDEIIKRHSPALRNALVMLLSRQTYEDLMAPEGKQRLRAEVLAELQRVLTEQTGAAVVDDVYFTSFVMQ